MTIHHESSAHTERGRHRSSTACARLEPATALPLFPAHGASLAARSSSPGAGTGCRTHSVLNSLSFNLGRALSNDEHQELYCARAGAVDEPPPKERSRGRSLSALERLQS